MEIVNTKGFRWGKESTTENKGVQNSKFIFNHPGKNKWMNLY